MNNHLAIFSRLLRAQLLNHDRVSLPGLGSFIAEDQPSRIMDDGRLICPPTRTVTFSVKESWNDEILERAYAAELEGAMLELDDDESHLGQQDGEVRNPSKLFIEQAKKDVAQFVSSVESQLQTTGSFHFPGLGVMNMVGKRREITFVKSADSDFAPQSFGLSPISVKPLPSPSRLQKLVKPQKTDKPEKPPKTAVIEPQKRGRPSKTQRDMVTGTQKRTPKWLLTLLGGLFVLILAVLFIYIFREEEWMRRFLWWLLYPQGYRP